MQILGTGFDGLVGSRFVELFSDRHDIVNVSLQTGFDLTNERQVHRTVTDSKADAVIHAAAFTDVAAAHLERGDKKGLCYRVNVDGTRYLATACAAAKKRLVFISTDYVFDGRQKSPYTEQDTPAPIEWYGETKWQAEQIVQQQGTDYCIARIAFPYRARFAAKPDILHKTLNGLHDGTLYPQFTDTLITPTFIDNIAVALDRLMTSRVNGVWHVVGSESLSNFAFAKKVAAAFALPVTVREGLLDDYLARNPERPYHRYLALSNAKLTAELGCKMANLEEGLAAVKVQL